MKTRQDAVSFALTLPETYEDRPFSKADWQVLRSRENGKMFLGVYEKDGFVCLNVKGAPAWCDFWRRAYKAVTPGWHQNKDHWNTSVLDGTVPEADIRKMIEDSYRCVTDTAAKRIYEAVKNIPKGKVATYGQVAAMACEPKMARAVGNALHKNPDPSAIPCHRVVNAAGELAGRFAFGGADVQAERLRAEGVEVTEYRVDLKKYQMK
ncbi:MAG: methylated-DNA--[Oscillospiraceae bacterium]|nr:methylated-DNA--[protein]-cysteine S-methyltransferase [Oscillospiraceae bacterium]